jgi:hypothetical protein
MNLSNAGRQQRQAKRLIKKLRKLSQRAKKMNKLWPHTFSTLDKLPPALAQHEQETRQAADALKARIAAARKTPGGVAALIDAKDRAQTNAR